MTSEAMLIGGVIFGVFFCLVAGTVVSGGFTPQEKTTPWRGDEWKGELEWREIDRQSGIEQTRGC